MIYTDLTKKAMKLCFDAHKSQTDKSGVPYVFHPFHVAEQTTSEEAAAVALLHDVVEDTQYTLSDISAMGFPKSVTDALALMTHDKSVPYMEYVAKIRENKTAREVKLADLEHNSDVSRLDGELTVKDLRRLAKYRIAKAVLSDDKFNEATGCFEKSIPLDEKGRYFLTFKYLDKRPTEYSLDIKTAPDKHYRFNEEDAKALKAALNSSVSLPELLAEYFEDHNENDFETLLNSFHK